MFNFYLRGLKNSRTRFGEIRMEVFCLRPPWRSAFHQPGASILQQHRQCLSGSEGFKMEQLGRTVTVIKPLVGFPKEPR